MVERERVELSRPEATGLN